MLRDLKKIFKSFSKNERTTFFTAFSLAIIASGFVGAGIISQTTTITPAAGGEYIEAIVGQPIAINPILAAGNNADEDLTTILFADILTLTKSIATSSDGSVWSVILKEGIKWSDGQPITADDVIYTIQTIQDPSANSPLQNQWKGIIVERRSEREALFTLKSGYSYFDETLKTLKVAPKHIFGVIPAANLRLSNYNLEPVGSGPYRFVSYEKQKNGFISKYKLEANPHFPGEKALIKKIELRFFSSFNDAVIAFNQKDVDGLGGIDSKSAADIKINHAEYNLPINQYYALFFNSTVNSALTDTSVRKALTLATNKEEILNAALGGKGKIMKGPLPESSLSYHANLYQANDFSVAQAESILNEAGWEISEEDGIRTNSSGEKLIIEVVVPDLPFLLDAARVLKANWESVNILTLLNTIPTSLIQDEYIATRNYQALLFGNVPRSGEDIYSFWHSAGRFHPGKNLALYNNPRVNSLLEQNQKIFDGEAKTVNLITIQEFIYEDSPAIFLFAPDYIYISSNSLGGFTEAPLMSGPDRLKNINQWFLKTDRVLR